jgi:hypothetical protein
MPLAPHPLSAPRPGAADTRAHFLETLLLALIAALLGRRSTRAATWHPAPDSDFDVEPLAYAAPLRHWHADCESPILYVIGPGPNRGMRKRERALPIPHPKTARAPPHLIFLEVAFPVQTHALFIPIS